MGYEYSNTSFRNEDIPSSTRVRRRDLQLFFKRLRFLGARFKYYAVGEYGDDSARAHYHVIMFGLDRRDRTLIERAWPFGIVDIGRVEPASIRYVTGYVMKAPLGRLRLHEERQGSYPTFSVMSQGLGLSRAIARRHTLVTQGAIRIGAKLVSAPRYYVNRLSEDDKQSFKEARRARCLALAVEGMNDGKPYQVNDVLDRATVSRADFRARAKKRGTL